MARRRGFRGIGRVRRMLRRLPDNVRKQMVGVLEGAGRGLKSAMRARAPKRTGALAQGIEYKVYPRSLRLRVGLLRTRAGRADLFYGRVQDLGRRQQTVVVRRLIRGGRAEWSGRIAGGSARASRKPNDLLTKPYPMKVPAMSAKRFVTGRFPDLRAAMRNGLKGVLARALRGSGGGGD
ncbi:MAG: HK97 gp10 family phage protein [Burkholderiaceae bacterium]